MINTIGYVWSSRMLLRYDVAAFVLCIGAFLSWPGLDLVVSQYFYSETTGAFIWEQRPVTDLIYTLTHTVGALIVCGLILLLTLSVFGKVLLIVKNRRVLAFLLSACLLGPLLIINMGFKGHWERPRPVQISEYGGSQTYEAPFSPTFQCQECRSFVSGHASVGFLFFAFALLSRNRRWLWVPILAGGFLGVVRMGQGGHFLSDIIFSGWVTWFSALFLYTVMLKKKAIQDGAAMADQGGFFIAQTR